jgi:hypothetical protein
MEAVVRNLHEAGIVVVIAERNQDIEACFKSPASEPMAKFSNRQKKQSFDQ